MTDDPDSPIDIAVVREDPGWDEEAERLCARAAAAALAAAGCETGELSILLSDDGHVAALNARFRQVEGPTNVLAFPAGAPGLIGDVIVARETTAAEAQDQGKVLAAHLSHLVVHGTLHLLGFDHHEDAEAVRMEALEVRILGELGIADPYAAERENVA
ncbi:MAG: rRNA maturation RNase YbeY [Alphaproteobacteria bacterium]|jgi:probable rRNA maturation factor|nr:rRNA maturation RNase YbeY [Alphaproteobacteria bacterium]